MTRLDANRPLLRELFLQGLPQNQVVALATTQEDMSLDNHAERANRIADNSARGAVATTTVPL